MVVKKLVLTDFVPKGHIWLCLFQGENYPMPPSVLRTSPPKRGRICPFPLRGKVRMGAGLEIELVLREFYAFLS